MSVSPQLFEGDLLTGKKPSLGLLFGLLPKQLDDQLENKELLSTQHGVRGPHTATATSYLKKRTEAKTDKKPSVEPSGISSAVAATGAAIALRCGIAAGCAAVTLAHNTIAGGAVLGRSPMHLGHLGQWLNPRKQCSSGSGFPPETRPTTRVYWGWS